VKPWEAHMARKNPEKSAKNTLSVPIFAKNA
jgi:hypothetical protein